jgi:hypothetical protein
MKLRILGLSLAVLMATIPFTSISSAAVKAGAKCEVVGQIKVKKSKEFTCIKLGKKLYWNNGVKLLTKEYRVGDRGPAGGIIFYAESSPKYWGKYLEVAPNGWFDGLSDPKVVWCDLTDREILRNTGESNSQSLTGNEIGKGKGNTQVMLNLCEYGAANLVAEYRGGGKSDWHLPSLQELNQLCKYARGQSKRFRECSPSGSLSLGFSDYYWSSSESSAKYAWDRFFNIGNSNVSNKDHDENSVRPIRSF